MSILFLGSGSFGRPLLERLAQLRPGRVVVGTVPDARAGRGRGTRPTPIKELASALGLPCHERATLRKEEGKSLLQDSGARCVIVSDFRLFLPAAFIKLFNGECYNFHPSLLPRHRGASPIPYAILAGDSEHGVTLYRMVKEMDAGPIVSRVVAPPPPDPGGWESPALEECLSRLAADLLEEWLPRLESGDVPLQEQDEERVTFAPKLTKDDGWIRWEEPTEAIDRRVRALKPWPRCVALWRRQGQEEEVDFERLTIDAVRPGPESAAKAPPGAVTEVTKERVVVACGPHGRQRITLLRLQRAGGKRPLAIDEFLHGARFEVGDRLTRPADPGARHG